MLRELLHVPDLVRELFTQRHQIEEFAKKYKSISKFFFLGRHYMHVTALEAALKLKEISYLNAIGLPAGEMKHGPIALIDSDSVVIGLFDNDKTFDKTLSNIQQVKARGAKVIAICSSANQDKLGFCDDLLVMPSLCSEATSILYSVACQLFAYYSALIRDCDIDQPRNLAKSVTVE